ncbi:MAG TPA: TVP38/TMEM64 family protein [Chloroflexota bacterium]|nr:TVP38/TMEM64 family protein [Chloroflexota bacterium]HUM67270.1 TVP38/TMEM64 family protein [Chloroflexota bacterium]
MNSQTNRFVFSRFWQRHGSKLFAFVFWITVVAGYYWYARQNGLTLEDSVSRLADLLANSLYGPLLYMVLYAIRPLVFFPATVLTLLGGFLFGPVGIIYTIIGSNASAMVAFGVGAYFGQGILEGKGDAGVIQQYMERMRENSFETVLIMRLIFLPYDLVNYAAGFLKINWKAFLAATAIGSVPGTVSFVLLGASFGTLDELLAGEIQLNPVTAVASILIIGISIALSRLIKKREGRLEQYPVEKESV